MPDGATVLLDAERGSVIVDPSAAQIAEAEARPSRRGAATSDALRIGVLADGTHIPLLANVDSAADAGRARAGAEGIGLFRTEFLFADAVEAPGRRRAVRALCRGPARIRRPTGRRAGVRRRSGQAAAVPERRREGNPALGLRGLRALRVHEPVLRDQLTALARAQRETGAELWVMAPMVADAEETEYFMRVGREQGLRIVGVTAEIPSLAVLADQVLELTDFVSIGTNDLTQFTMAADRELGVVSSYQDPWHPAVLRLAERLALAAIDAGKPVGICGEAASDPNSRSCSSDSERRPCRWRRSPSAECGPPSPRSRSNRREPKRVRALAARTASEARAAARAVGLALD